MEKSEKVKIGCKDVRIVRGPPFDIQGGGGEFNILLHVYMEQFLK